MEKRELFRSFQQPSGYAREHLVFCEGMGEENSGQFYINRNYFNNYLVMYAVTGELVVHQYGRTFSVPAGRSILMDLRDPHTYYFARGSRSRILWFTFRGIPVQNLMESVKYANAMPLMGRTPWMQQSVEMLFDAVAADRRTRELEVSGAIYGILIRLICDEMPMLQDVYDPMSSFQRRMSQFIRSHIREKLTLDVLAEHAGMSRSKFCSLFKSTFSVTPFDYIRTERIELAKHLLIYTNDSIGRISSDLQFHDQSYFTNTFHRITGMTPRLYRQKHLQTSPDTARESEAE